MSKSSGDGPIADSRNERLGHDLRVLMLTSAVEPRVGGPFESMSGLARGLSAAAGADVQVMACVFRPLGWQQHVQRWGSARLSIYEGGVFHRLSQARRFLLASLHDRAFDIVHASGLWDESTLLARAVAERSDVPVVWSIRGMLEPWALAHHSSRKALAWAAVQRAALNAATVIHATAGSEARSCRRAGLRQPIALIPNGIDIGPLGTSVRRSDRRTLRRCAYLGRLHPKKGLPNLIEAWSRCDTTAWELVIAGPDSSGHAALLTSLVRRHGLANVHVRGGAYGDDRREFLEDCDLFVCPTFSENFGIAIAEAMERGKPVITTTGTPWSILKRERMGWWVDASPPALAEALAEALAASPETLRVMGDRCRSHVVNSYSWEGVVDRMRAVYEWTLGGPQPACLLTEMDLPA